MPLLAWHVTNNCHFSKVFGGEGNIDNGLSAALESACKNFLSFPLMLTFIHINVYMYKHEQNDGKSC